jgi:hypothetical protein
VKNGDLRYDHLELRTGLERPFYWLIMFGNAHFVLHLPQRLAGGTLGIFELMLAAAFLPEIAPVYELILRCKSIIEASHRSEKSLALIDDYIIASMILEQIHIYLDSIIII